MDFSSTRDTIANKWAESDEHDGITRFFAGVPKIKNKKKDSMEIYLCFMQHILWSLKEEGKAAIVVPTGFITSKSGIEKKIRKVIIDNGWLKGVISMPPNIFANTGTNVSVIFIDKSNKSGDSILIDASNLGQKVKEGKVQKIVLNPDEIVKIENTFINNEEIDDFSVIVSNDKIKELGYSFSASQYFDVKIEHVEISSSQFYENIELYSKRLNHLFNKGHDLEKSINDLMGDLIYE